MINSESIFIFLSLQAQMMKNIKIIADDKIPFLKGALENSTHVVYLRGNEISHADVQNADALLVRTRTKCNKDLLDNTSIKFIASATIGYDHIDTEYCKENGIAWANAPGCNASSVEQYVVAALLELANRLGFELSSKTIGIVGVGHVGSKIARAASVLGMRVLLNDPPRKRIENSSDFIDLETLQKEADIISFHVPLNRNGEDRTLNIVDDQFLKKLKKGAILINTSRGEIIDENDLESAIDRELLSATVLDVWRNEPFINLNLLEKTTMATPHIAGYSADGKAKGTEMSVRALSSVFKLGLADWIPEKIPLPENPLIKINCQNKIKQEIISETYQYTYNISKDDAALRENPDSFEALRENYPIRREANAYTIHHSKECGEPILLALKNLGFHF